MSNRDQRYRPSPRVAFRAIGGQVVIVPGLEQKMITLNATGTFLWQRLQGRGVDELAAELSARFEVGREQAEADTREFIDEMIARGFLEELPPGEGHEGG